MSGPRMPSELRTPRVKHQGRYVIAGVLFMIRGREAMLPRAEGL